MSNGSTPRPLTETERETCERVAAALYPFVSAWHLPLNPDDVDEIAYAVVAYALSNDPIDDIVSHVDVLVEHLAREQSAQRALWEQQLATQAREGVLHVLARSDSTACGRQLGGLSWTLPGHVRSTDNICAVCAAALS